MADKQTPMMEQYRTIRSGLPADTILFFRLGDFYEMFFDDAREAAEILGIALTRRNKVPMCGVPYHSVEAYLAKLMRAGRKVAICEQVEDPAQAKGIVRREVTRIITPGTVTEENVLSEQRNNYLAGLYFENGLYGVAFLDLSTGTFWFEEHEEADSIRDTLIQQRPGECLLPDDQAETPSYRAAIDAGHTALITPYEAWTFEPATAADFLKRHFQVHSMEGFGCPDHSIGLGAAGALLHYVSKTLKNRVDHIRRIRICNSGEFMRLDDSTAANLELTSARSNQQQAPTLLSTLDATRTAMGGRLIRDWVLRPLCDRQAIEERLDAVGCFYHDRLLLDRVRERLGMVRDMERLIARLQAGNGNARDLRALIQSLQQLPSLRAELEQLTGSLPGFLASRLDPLNELCEQLDRELVDDPPAGLKDGGLIREGCRPQLDEFREASRSGKKWLADFQKDEQESTGIKSLKVRHNKVFGYYIEVTKTNLDLIPEHYVRKQTLVNAERFITPELKERENSILGAHDKAVALEYEIFCELRDAATACTESIQQSAEAVAYIDALAGLADRALYNNYQRPAITDGDTIRLEEGRHPVIEQIPQAENFVPNDALLDNTENQLLIITGPNMAGKSTYIRQVALIVLMAQIGSYVPATRAEIGVVDRIFTRVGASDDLTRGRSTFMVEMQETANILNNATGRSLIVLDEIGRGTSTFDGISIAWAVAEFLHNNQSVKAKTLFATHYHELTELALTMDGVQNYNILVKEQGERIAFLRRIAPGSADKSYGIQVARLAGLPKPVIDRAGEILSNLEESELNDVGQPQLARRRSRRKPADDAQLNLFAEPEQPEGDPADE